MDLDPGRKSILAWAEGAPDVAGAEFVPAKEKYVVEAPDRARAGWGRSSS